MLKGLSMIPILCDYLCIVEPFCLLLSYCKATQMEKTLRPQPKAQQMCEVQLLETQDGHTEIMIEEIIFTWFTEWCFIIALENIYLISSHLQIL